MYNNLRRRLLTLCQLPKHDPLHRAAWMAFSALEMLILASAPDDSGTAADTESALHMVRTPTPGFRGSRTMAPSVERSHHRRSRPPHVGS